MITIPDIFKLVLPLGISRRRRGHHEILVGREQCAVPRCDWLWASQSEKLHTKSAFTELMAKGSNHTFLVMKEEARHRRVT